MHDFRAPGRPEKTQLRLGYIPLSDCAPLAVANELNFFREEGLSVTLCREPSWSNIRDKVALGLLDGAHMLATLPLAMSLGLGAVTQSMAIPLVLGLNGNAITVSTELYDNLERVAPETTRAGHAHGLKTLIERGRPLRFAHVFPGSTHFYQLCDWLSAAGIDPLSDVQLVVVPPPRMVDALAMGAIDGFCVGEPWNTDAVLAGLGHMTMTSSQLWPNRAEKVLGITRAFAQKHPHTVAALTRALLRAGLWLDAAGNRERAARLLAQGAYLQASSTVIEAALVGRRYDTAGTYQETLPDFLVFGRYAAGFPWLDDAVWLLAQMRRLRQLQDDIDLHATAADILMPDAYRAAARALGAAYPTVDRRPAPPHAGAWRLTQASSPIDMGPDLPLYSTGLDPDRPPTHAGIAPATPFH